MQRVNQGLQQRARQARADIVQGTLRSTALLAQLEAIPVTDRDVWIDDVLGIEPPPPDEPLPRGAVPYLPCAVDDIIAMVRDVPLRPTDVLVDLGSGLGRVAILAHLLSGARACGIEIQEALVRSARARCAALGLPQVTFVHGNAAEVDVDGTVYFLYAPFNGDLLTAVIQRLANRRLTIATVGVELDVPWLTRRSEGTLAIYDAIIEPCA